MIIRFRMKNLLKSVKTINKKENVLKQMIFANITIIVIINCINISKVVPSGKVPYASDSPLLKINKNA